MPQTPKTAAIKITNILEELRLEVTRRLIEALPSYSRASSVSKPEPIRRRRISKLSKKEQLLYYFDRGYGFWTRNGSYLYKAKKSGTKGTALLVSIDDPNNAILVNLDTLIDRWTYLKQASGAQ